MKVDWKWSSGQWYSALRREQDAHLATKEQQQAYADQLDKQFENVRNLVRENTVLKQQVEAYEKRLENVVNYSYPHRH